MSKHITLAEAASLIPDGAIVSVSSSSGLGCPDLMLKAIGERFDATGHPRDLTTLHPIAAGEMSHAREAQHEAGCPDVGKRGIDIINVAAIDIAEETQGDVEVLRRHPASTGQAAAEKAQLPAHVLR